MHGKMPDSGKGGAGTVGYRLPGLSRVKKWQQTYSPLEVLRNVEELFGAGEELNLEAMNGTDIPFDG